MIIPYPSIQEKKKLAVVLLASPILIITDSYPPYLIWISYSIVLTRLMENTCNFEVLPWNHLPLSLVMVTFETSIGLIHHDTLRKKRRVHIKTTSSFSVI
jgi:hypothetical protein